MTCMYHCYNVSGPSDRSTEIVFHRGQIDKARLELMSGADIIIGGHHTLQPACLSSLNKTYSTPLFIEFSHTRTHTHTRQNFLPPKDAKKEIPCLLTCTLEAHVHVHACGCVGRQKRLWQLDLDKMSFTLSLTLDSLQTLNIEFSCDTHQKSPVP